VCAPSLLTPASGPVRLAITGSRSSLVHGGACQTEDDNMRLRLSQNCTVLHTNRHNFTFGPGSLLEARRKTNVHGDRSSGGRPRTSRRGAQRFLTLNASLDVVDIDAVVPDRTAQPIRRNSARSARSTWPRSSAGQTAPDRDDARGVRGRRTTPRLRSGAGPMASPRWMLPQPRPYYTLNASLPVATIHTPRKYSCVASPRLKL
jgi:hypothetical protein